MDYLLLTEQKISEKYKGLPQDLKNVLSSADTLVIMKNITAKYQLDEEKIEILIQLVGLVILGFATFEDMKKEMKESIDIDSQFIPLIADEIHQKIFLPVINSLQKTINAPAPTTPTGPIMPPVTATAPAAPRPATPPTPSADHYREPAARGPEVIDLRKAPPIVSKPVTPKPVMPLIEAEPHKVFVPAPLIAAPEGGEPRPSGREAEPHKVPIPVPAPLSGMPQVILRPPGLPPTGLPRDILDLRKDKGEF